jgi:hypothetical protein
MLCQRYIFDVDRLRLRLRLKEGKERNVTFHFPEKSLVYWFKEML